MSQNHYFMTLNRKTVERIADLTWEQFVKRYGWDGAWEWQEIGTFLAFAFNRPNLPDELSDEEIAPLLKWTIRKSLPRMSPQYFLLLVLAAESGLPALGEKITENTQETAGDCYALLGAPSSPSCGARSTIGPSGPS